MKNKSLLLLVLHLGLAAVVAQPAITCQPSNQTAIAGSTVTFTVCATGAPPLSYQWRSHANPSSYTNIPFGTEATLVLTNVQPTSRRFAVVVTDAGGLSATSSPLAQLTVLLPPSITRQPASQLAELGNPAAISVTVTGTPTLSYQWLFDGQPLAGQTRTNVSWTSVQLSNAGAYSVIVTNVGGSITSQAAILNVGSPIFTRITNGLTATDTGYSYACAWIDYNNDGWTDLLVANRYVESDSQSRKSVLYQNLGGGAFIRVTNSITTTGGSSLGVAWGDLDNDGWLDCFVANPVQGINYLFLGTGDDGFTRILDGSVVNSGRGSHGGVWGDYDADGLLDLFVVNHGDVPDPNFLLHNRGGRLFDSMVFGDKPPGTGSSTSAGWCDYDHDGDLDLFVTNGGWVGVQRNALYRNEGNGTFTRLTNAVPALEGGRSESSTWGDYDNDGYPDLFVANITSVGGGKNFLYHNKGDGTFTRITTSVIAEDAADGIGCAWADFDNDGYLDLFVANGEFSIQESFLYHNNRDGNFRRVAAGLLGANRGASAGCAWGDYDNDGFVDLFVSNFLGSSRGPPQQNFLYRNNGNSNAWLHLKLEGTAFNRSAIGAKVRVMAMIGGQTMWQLREVSGGNGFGSQNDLRAHFGLGDATNADIVRIEWPSGTMQELHNVAAKQFLTITEPPRLLASKTNGEPQFSLKGRRGSDYQVDTSFNLTTWASLGVVTITNQNGTARIVETNTLPADQRFYRAVSR